MAVALQSTPEYFARHRQIAEYHAIKYNDRHQMAPPLVC
jgi:hypothetical protein